MAAFQPIPNRDAHASIAGYFYQFDTTILRWLNLHAGNVLVLECGEDIDMAARSMHRGADTEALRERLLEQVKHRSDRLTLRSPTAVSSVASFLLHRELNSEQDLFFRYTTTATVGMEQGCQFPDDMPGVETWERFRRGRLGEQEKSAAICETRRVFSEASAVDQLDDGLRPVFQDFWSSASAPDIEDVMLRFEWATAAEQPESLRRRIQSHLMDRNVCTGEGDAEDLYYRLLYHVLECLSRPGLKQLTTMDLSRSLSRPTLSQADRERLTTIGRLLDTLEQRVSTVEVRQARMHSQQHAITSILQEHISEHPRLIEASHSRTQRMNLEPPPLIERGSSRSDAITWLLRSLGEHDWVSILGSIGTGKTQLAVLAAQQAGGPVAWVTLRDLEDHEVVDRLDSALVQLADCRFEDGLDIIYRDGLRSLGEEGLFVLDDIPPIATGTVLHDRAIRLARACATAGCPLLSTSHSGIAEIIDDFAPGCSFHESTVPSFTTGDIEQLLTVHGAPGSIATPEFAVFLSNITSDHPVLLTASIRYLIKRGWQVEDQELEDLIGGEAVSQLSDQVIRRLLRTVENERSVRLLWRLCTEIGAFPLDDVVLLAAIDPSIPSPRTHYTELKGIWVQEESNSVVSVSPMVQRACEPDLLDEEMRDCHQVIANRILSQRRLSAHELSLAITHLLKADDPIAAATHLAFALLSLHDQEELVEDALLLSIWSDTPMPDDVTPVIGSLIRSLQIPLRERYGKSNSFAIQSLEVMLSELPPAEAWAAVPAAVYAVPSLSRSNPSRATRVIGDVLRLVPSMVLPDGEAFPFPETAPLEFFAWLPCLNINGMAHVREWLDMVERLAPDQLQRLAQVEEADQAAKIMIDRIWLAEKDKPQGQQDWLGVVTDFQEVATRAEELGLALLQACAIRGQITAQAEYRGDLEGAVAHAREAMASVTDETAIFLLEECVGRQYFCDGGKQQALYWLDRALSRNTDRYPQLQVDARLYASAASAETDSQAALRYAEDGAKVAQALQGVPATKRVQAFGELAIAVWRAADATAAFSACDQAAEAFLAAQYDPGVGWRDAGTLLAHVCGFLASISHFGVPPASTGDGEEYIAPSPGVFLTESEERAQLLTPEREVGLMTVLAQYAGFVGDIEREFTWANRGVDRAKAEQSVLLLSELQSHMLPKMIDEQRYEEALGIGVEAAAGMCASNEFRKQGGDAVRQRFSVEGLLGDKPSALWDDAEGWAMNLTVLPMTLRLSLERQRSPADAGERATGLIGLCREFSYDASDAEAWDTAAQLLEYAFVEEDANRLKEEAQALSQTSGPLALTIMAYVGFSIQESVSSRDAICAHLSIVPVTDALMRGGSLVPTLLHRFLAEHWMRRCAETPFHFSRIARRICRETAESPTEVHVRLLIATLANEFRIPLPPQQEAWLGGEAVDWTSHR